MIPVNTLCMAPRCHPQASLSLSPQARRLVRYGRHLYCICIDVVCAKSDRARNMCEKNLLKVRIFAYSLLLFTNRALASSTALVLSWFWYLLSFRHALARATFEYDEGMLHCNPPHATAMSFTIEGRVYSPQGRVCTHICMTTYSTVSDA